MKTNFSATEKLLSEMGLELNKQRALGEVLSYSDSNEFATYEERINYAKKKIRNSMHLRIDNIRRFVRFFDDTKNVKIPECELHLFLNLYSEEELQLQVPRLNEYASYFEKVKLIGDEYASNYFSFLGEYSAKGLAFRFRKKFDEAIDEALKKDIFLK